MAEPRVFKMAFSKVYPLYLQKVEKKGRTKAELDAVIAWLTGYGEDALHARIGGDGDIAAFFNDAPEPNPDRDKVKGVVCGVRVETVEDPLMRDIRILDKMVDELARGKAMNKVLRT